MKSLLKEIKKCVVCAEHLPQGPRPILQASPRSRIVIIGQAPGQKVHKSGVAWDDPSGKELRRWLNVSPEQFYNPDIFALIPMGFCYPGKGKSGDLPPRPECAPLWHQALLRKIDGIGLTILIGQYSQKYYLRDNFQPTLTENVRNFRLFLPGLLPLVHPSPRNRIWQRKNPWFEKEVVPELQSIVKKLIMRK